MTLARRKHTWLFIFALIGAMILAMTGCKKDDVFPDSVTDIDGNVYKTVKIGDQLWMAENLRTTRYNDGTGIPTGHSDVDWMALTTGAYAVFSHALVENLNSDAEVLKTYGALYNWYAIETGNLCPAGWRVPTDEDMKQLEGTVDSGYEVGHQIWDHAFWRGYDVGIRLKSESGWVYHGNGSNDYGFAALPAGLRLSSADTQNFQLMGYYSYFWTSTEEDPDQAWSRRIYFDHGGVARRTHDKSMGYSVRCLWDK